MIAMALLVSSAHVSYPFVARGQEYDGNEGDQQREPACHAPLWKNDAEVFGRPGEEHLRTVSDWRSIRGCGLTFIEHWFPISMSPWPWSISPWSMSTWSMRMQVGVYLVRVAQGWTMKRPRAHYST